MAVEARSLASLSDYASNPPDRPNTTRRPHTGPLVLYIVRVPGSQDIFLTTIKPRDKVVSAEDVNSSIYYLHVDLPSDSHLAEAVKAQRVEDLKYEPHITTTSPTASDQNSHPRGTHISNIPKASEPHPTGYASKLPSSRLQSHRAESAETRRYFDENTQVQPINGSQQHHLSQEISQYSSLQSMQEILPDSSSYSLLETPSKPSIILPQSYSGTLANNVTERYNEETTPYTQAQQLTGESFPINSKSKSMIRRKPILQDQQSIPSVLTSVNTNMLQTLPPPNSSKLITNPHSRTPKRMQTLTLVRRVPFSSDQWNVAIIMDPVNEQVTSFVSGKHNEGSKGRHTPLTLEILNPSYAKFEKQRLEGFQRDNGSTEKVFFRRVIAPDMSFLPSATGFTTKSSDSHSSLFGHKGLFKNRIISRNSVSPAIQMRPEEEERYQRLGFAELPVSSKGLAKTCYSFMSPWSGRCEILESLTGNALRCRHASPALAHLAGPKGPVTVQVSELKFNLPGGSRSKTAPNLSSRPASFHSDHQRKGSLGSDKSGSINSPDEGNDLSLGKERAGGGFGGKKAKLGKLIIEGEGLDMLDLVVAANLGLWWRVFSKQFN